MNPIITGGHSSGKSTIFKQMKILHLNGFTESDYVNYRYLIHANTMEAVKQIITGGQDLGITLDEDIEVIGRETDDQGVTATDQLVPRQLQHRGYGADREDGRGHPQPLCLRVLSQDSR